MIPSKLNKGDKIMVIAPSGSLSIVSERNREIAVKKLEELGFKVELSNHSLELDDFNSSAIESRVSDINKAFKDDSVKGILTAIGGFNVNQILKHLDYELIKDNPKILCGFSDITALSNAIYAKTNLATYSGPHFSTFGMVKGIDYTVEYFIRCLTKEDSFKVKPSKEWSDDFWFLNQKERTFIENNGMKIINKGEAEGTIIGGNLNTFNLLQGTEFMPKFNNSILFLEEDYLLKDKFDVEFDRNLQSLIHLKNFNGVKALVFGRFQKNANVTTEKLKKIIKVKRELESIPIIADVDFGHTTPIITFPIGGRARLLIKNSQIGLEILEH
ncbi:LD-carboxypeptidase [Patescibacteria group bacterium]|nr:LD-carboxypeptidase [Patescibacteria group bacterium]MBU2265403.1 LD-carboxypeptidase [Patescibacteria group bacterium]